MGTENETRKKTMGVHLTSMVVLVGEDKGVKKTGVEIQFIPDPPDEVLARVSRMIINAQNHAELTKLRNVRADTKAPLPGKPQMVHNKHRH